MRDASRPGELPPGFARADRAVRLGWVVAIDLALLVGWLLCAAAAAQSLSDVCAGVGAGPADQGRVTADGSGTSLTCLHETPGGVVAEPADGPLWVREGGVAAAAVAGIALAVRSTRRILR